MNVFHLVIVLFKNAYHVIQNLLFFFRNMTKVKFLTFMNHDRIMRKDTLYKTIQKVIEGNEGGLFTPRPNFIELLNHNK